MSLLNIRLRNKEILLSQVLLSFRHRKIIPVFLLLHFYLCGSLFGQTMPVSAGAPNWLAYDGGLYDRINLQNLNISVNVPIMSKAGAIPFNFGLVSGANDLMHLIGTVGSTESTIAPVTTGFSSSVDGILGLPYTPGTALFAQSATGVCPSANGSGYTTAYWDWFVQLADGTVHWFPNTFYAFGPTSTCSGTYTSTTVDGSGFQLVLQASISLCPSSGSPLPFCESVYDPRGNLLSPTAIKDTQSSANYVRWSESQNSSAGTWTDSLGQAELSQAAAGNSWSWTDVNGGSPTASVTYSNYTVGTAFACPGVYDSPNAQISLPSKVNFPDLSALGISFDTSGRLSQLVMRDGSSTINYNYNPNNSSHGGLNCTYLIPNSITRTTSDGTSTYTWAVANNGSGNTTTVVDAGGNHTVYTFTGLTATGNAPPPVTQALTQVVHNQDTSTTLTTDLYCYNGLSGQPGNCATAVVSLPIAEVDVYHTINGMTTSSRSQSKYDAYGNVTYSAQYDFVGTTPTTTTTITYGSCTASCSGSFPTITAIGSNVTNEPGRMVTVLSGNTVADSRYTYDSHGNLQTTYLWTGSSWLSNTTANTYNTNGTPIAKYDVANNPTTYVYDSSSYTACSACTNYPFPTSITLGSLTTRSTWYGTGGVKRTDVGPNESTQTTTYGYTACSGGAADPLWRVLSVTDPNENEICKTYPSGSSPDISSTSFAFNSGNSIQHTITTTDGYGRVTNVQTQQGPSSTNYDTVSTSYAWGGSNNDKRLVNTNLPCTEPLNGTCGLTQQAFIDVLGRNTWSSIPTTNEYVSNAYTQNDVLSVLGPAPPSENLKQIQKQYDGLGRLQYLCAIGSVSGSAPCNQNTGSSSGVTTSYSYPTNGSGQRGFWSTRGAQTRITNLDSLGRIIYKSTPEAGITTYTYDTVPSACSGSAVPYAGKLISVAFANGNTNCYEYDVPQGRLTAITGLSGSGGSGVCRRFYYDNSTGALGALPSGVSLSNPYGRMVEAETDTCVWPITSNTMITDEWFSYDNDGNQTDIWELTPHSTQYYHSTATFAGNGAVLSVQLASPSLYTETYGLDGEGRLKTLSSAGQTIVSSTSYNAASQPLFIYLGTGSDQDQYLYSGNTGAMTNWTFQVASTSETGALSWNQNGTLQQLAITDGFNTAGSQTCNFGTSSIMGYDDLGRLLSDNCGSSVWAQTFSYDEYSNMTTTGSSSWIPGYSATNNHYLSPATYDNSGNVTNDSLHAYGWDPFNKLISIDSSACGTSGECTTYDALGRVVETSSGSAYTELWYTQLGKAVYMHGTAPYYAYFPTPGGGTVEVNGNAVTHYYMHKDWLGNSRISSTIINHTIVADQAYSPYGVVYNKLATEPGVPAQMYTGDTSDILAGVFDTPNRELNASQGRWLSPDPAGAGWNQYAYSTNPMGQTDPTGLQNDGCNGNYFCSLFESGGNSLYGTFVGGFLTSAQFLQGVIGVTNNNPAAPVVNGKNVYAVEIAAANCSAGCVTSSAINSLDGKVVGTVGSDNGGFWNSIGTFASDALGLVAAVLHSTRLGYASSALSLAAEPTAKNVILNAGSTVIPIVVEGSDFPIAVGFAGYDGSQFVANQAIIPVFTPDALQSNTIEQNGILMPSPQAIFDSGQFAPSF